MTAVWLAATYPVAALLLAVRIGRRLRNQGDSMYTPDPIYRELRARRVRSAAFERIGEVGLEDEAEWLRELMHTDDTWDALAFNIARMGLAILPAPEFDGEDHL